MRDVQRLVLARQLQALEDTLQDLRSTVEGFARIAALHDRQVHAAANIIPDLKLPTGALRACMPLPMPSIAECIDGLKQIRLMYADELALKRAIVDQLTYDSTAEDLAALQALFIAEPNIPAATVADVLSLVLVTIKEAKV
ncbi:unnamed protein product [Ostreobium quekettii]|uniref:Uncharacterized protein n=1 Tax=Ostreobium quekettii TaxID=121088 RepID=A0A8S1JIV3_9CHLO|nr:unnamed protein product [Ostreobium quekettii]